MVGHVGFADPFDAALGRVVEKVGSSSVLEGTDVKLHTDKLLICMGVFETTGAPHRDSTLI